MTEVTASDLSTAERIANGEMHPAMVEAIGMLAQMRAEHDRLSEENEQLRRRIAEEDERLARG